MKRKLGHPIIHAGQGCEYWIVGTSVDRYYEVKLANALCYVLQFHDCFWHSLNCYQINRERKLTDGASHEDTINTNEFSQWHDVFDNADIEWKKNGSVNLHEKSARIARCTIFSKTILINPLLDPREAFFRPYGKYRNPIRSYGYGKNTLYGYVFSVSVLKMGFSFRPTYNLYRKTRS